MDRHLTRFALLATALIWMGCSGGDDGDDPADASEDQGASSNDPSTDPAPVPDVVADGDAVSGDDLGDIGDIPSWDIGDVVDAATDAMDTGETGGDAAQADTSSDTSGGVDLADATGGDGGGGDVSSPDLGDLCPAATPADGGMPRVVISEVDFENGTATLTNVSGAEADLDGWTWCARPAYASIGEILLADGDSATLELPAGIDSIAQAGGELAIYTSFSFTDADDIVAFVSWGDWAPAANGTRESVAVDAGVWANGDRVMIGDGDGGIRAYGDVGTATGWAALVAECF